MKQGLISKICEKIKKPVLIAVSVATLAITPYISGCQTQSAYERKFNSLSPEEQAKRQQHSLYLSQELAKREWEKQQHSLYLSQELAKREWENRQTQSNQNYPVKSQAERDADVIDDMKGRVGGNLATQGLLKALADHAR